MNLFQYLSTVARLWNNGDGPTIARFISLSGNHVTNKSLHVENSESVVERHLESPIDEVVNTHLKTLYYMHEARKHLICMKMLMSTLINQFRF
jgi:hypothetical protein